MGNAFMETFCGIFQHKYCKECNCQYVGTQPFDDALFFSDSDSLCTLIESDTRKKKKKICTDNFVCTVFCIKRSSCQHSECNLRTEWICKYNHSVIDRKTVAFNVISTVFPDNVYRF